MNNINEKLLHITRKALARTEKAMERTGEIPKVSFEIQYKGCLVGLGIGTILIVGGIIGLLMKKQIWGLGTLIAGTTTIISNIITMKKLQAQR
ncbi:hypothetical protein KQI41_08570 [Tissierella pigra]|uniref:Uncharacterized protein n=1 Tax=Tissierella pigra TaxID=2607614 RepID=A0A6N7Y4M6_9FIRM|nr:hypothetical protein [Tissierella pigra]MBU5426453.1 hypothetical protein [Tissierella pigra]MSU03398.1 hypothetical protein [Tissierella pigra]